MLDQNTDRMWYVIGAVIVGAAIILILNGTMPQIFASVAGTFAEKTNQTPELIEGMFPPVVDLQEATDGVMPKGVHYLEPNDMTLRNSRILDYDSATRTYTLELLPSDQWSQGFRIKDSADLEIPYGDIFKLQYDVLPPIDMYVRNDINNSIVKDDGSLNYVNDGDDTINRIGQDRTYARDVDGALATGNEWSTMLLMYRNKNNVSRNPEKMPLLDSTIFGLHNATDEPVIIQMRNVRVSIY